MARIRYLKPGFFSNEYLGKLPPLARLAFEGLWCYADRKGRLEDRPGRLRAAILPYDPITDEEFSGLLEMLQAKPGEFIVRYSVEGRALIAICRFLDHQKIHHKESPSVLPGPDGADGGPPLAPSSPPTCPPLAPPWPPRKEEGERELIPLKAPTSGGPHGVFSFWKWVHGFPNAVFDGTRSRKINARLREFSEGTLLGAIVGVTRSEFHMGRNEAAEMFNDISIILRDAPHVEKFSGLITAKEAFAWVQAYRTGGPMPWRPRTFRGIHAVESLRRDGPEEPPTPERQQEIENLIWKNEVGDLQYRLEHPEDLLKYPGAKEKLQQRLEALKAAGPRKVMDERDESSNH